MRNTIKNDLNNNYKITIRKNVSMTLKRVQKCSVRSPTNKNDSLIKSAYQT